MNVEPTFKKVVKRPRQKDGTGAILGRILAASLPSMPYRLALNVLKRIRGVFRSRLSLGGNGELVPCGKRQTVLFLADDSSITSTKIAQTIVWTTS